ncbi:hypothetical protein TUBRATIS_11740 [Tubulinosema ratisbonensis]|uniref:Uncharacterized protein n=1 Tax=Tubulinosema ratisbonensis TaxID=291195 RepID=A0A437AMD0_9MICR|nr:hypothetical protein TUBRATIS_11740 [Tubulinosema ratisbonensis]
MNFLWIVFVKNATAPLKKSITSNFFEEPKKTSVAMKRPAQKDLEVSQMNQSKEPKETKKELSKETERPDLTVKDVLLIHFERIVKKLETINKEKLCSPDSFDFLSINNKKTELGTKDQGYLMGFEKSRKGIFDEIFSYEDQLSLLIQMNAFLDYFIGNQKTSGIEVNPAKRQRLS